MLSLALLRHAKSSWEENALNDFDRPLSERGLKSAPRAGKALLGFGFRPTLVLCSTAQRTRETLDLCLPVLVQHGNPPQVRYDDRLYLASSTTILEVIRDAGGASPSLLVVGHNPGRHHAAVTLAGSGEAGLIQALNDKMPTAAVALMSFARQRWRDIRSRDGNLVAYWTPKGA